MKKVNLLFSDVVNVLFSLHVSKWPLLTTILNNFLGVAEVMITK